MTVKTTSLLLGAIAVLAAGAPAYAGGEYEPTGIKDYSTGVPVPAPVPIPVYGPEWYTRVDLGGSWLTSGTIDEIGSALVPREPSATTPTWFGGIGAGYYITPSIRGEVSFDMSTDVEVTKPGVYTYTDSRQAKGPDYTDAAGVTVGTFDTKYYDVERTDHVKLSQNYGLVSVYYDFKNSSAFTPYIGAGLGFTYRVLTRHAHEDAECSDTRNSHPAVDATYPPGTCVNTTDLPNTYTTDDDVKTKQWDIAAAAMAGFGYQLPEGIVWDNSYRYMWEGGSIRLTAPTVAGSSTIIIKDVGEHQFRTGLRFDLN